MEKRIAKQNYIKQIIKIGNARLSANGLFDVDRFTPNKRVYHVSQKCDNILFNMRLNSAASDTFAVYNQNTF